VSKKPFRLLSAEVMGGIHNLLCDKNEQYGDSALSPIRVFSKADAEAGIRIRIDDKLSRLASRDDRLESEDDVIDDLIGYLVLLKIAKRESEGNETEIQEI
jgi:hypothetical protein